MPNPYLVVIDRLHSALDVLAEAEFVAGADFAEYPKRDAAADAILAAITAVKAAKREAALARRS